MKKVLFVAESHFGLYKIFEKGIQNAGLEVTTVPIQYEEFKKYKNLKQRIHNFYAKKFLKKNLKDYFRSAGLLDSIPKKARYDYVFIICPEILHQDHLKYLKSISKKMIVYFWDGFDHFPKYEATVPFFDECYSFDPIDVKKYNLNFITNFYFVENRNTEPKTDLFFLSSYDSRYPLVEKIVSLLEKQNKKILVYQYIRNPETTVVPHKNKSIQYIDQYISIEDAAKLTQESRIVLDIHKSIQHGLSFRVFEAMGLGKKLITTNKDIVNYDFYNPNNIFIWEEDTEAIPEDFLNTPYAELPEDIYRKYSRESWIKKVFDL